MHIRTIVKSSRPPFLILTPICVLLGLSTSLSVQPKVDLYTLFLVLLGATSAHISVNELNEYFDFKSGLDAKTQKTAFSGGSGALLNHPEMAPHVLCVGLLGLLVTIAIGVYFLFAFTALIAPIGVLGLLLIVSYTHWLNRRPWLCLIAPGLGFGSLMVLGTHVMLTGEFSEIALLVSLIPFFLVNNLLLLNQYPDMLPDSDVGRRTFPIRFGVLKSSVVYGVFALAAYLQIVILLMLEILPMLAVIALFPLFLSVFAISGMFKYATEIGSQPKYMAANVGAALATPALLAVSLGFG